MPTKTEATKATEEAGTKKKQELNKLRRNIGTYGGIGTAAILLFLGWAIDPPQPAPAKVATQQSHETMTTPQVVYARTNLVIPVGLEWGAPVAFIGHFCAFWDSPAAGLQWETSMDGKTWGSDMPFNYARFRAPVATTAIFTLQDPSPPGETCKRRR